MSLYETETQEKVNSKTVEENNEPPMYKVLLLNDDYTTMEFVVEVLVRVFRKSIDKATQIMLNVHENGVGLCGIYPYDVAETKVTIVHNVSRERGFPLRCTMEKE